jgi:hypothetical protein
MLCTARRTPCWILPAAFALLLACSDGSRESASIASEEALQGAGGEADAARGYPPPPPPPMEAPAAAKDIGFAAGADVAALPAQGIPSQAVSGTAPAERSMIIRMGEARLEVDSLEAGVAAVQRMAAAAGGWIAHSSLSLGERQVHTARMEVKVPAERWDELVAGLGRIGELRQLTAGTEDVGEQFVDLTAQLANAERLEERYLQLLETRTGSLEDLLAVERELGRVRERIEMMQGRLRYLNARVAISTLVVNLEEPTDLLALSPEAEPIRDALRAAWRNFVAVITGGIALLGAVVPVALLLAAAVAVWRWIRRRRRVQPAVGDR